MLSWHNWLVTVPCYRNCSVTMFFRFMGGCVAHRKLLLPTLVALPSRDFFSLLLSLWTVLWLNPSSAKQWILEMQLAMKSRARFYNFFCFSRFDMAVNGGGGVTLQFQRSPLKATTRTTFLPWNKIIVINPVVMTSYGGAGISWDEEDTSTKVS